MLNSKELDLTIEKNKELLKSILKKNKFQINDNLPDITFDCSKEIASCIDHTILKSDATENEILKLCEEADRYGFASVCVNPVNVKFVKKNLKNSKVCSVIGFPLGASDTSIKTAETEFVINFGADEIDMVINVGFLKDKKYDKIFFDIKSVADVCKKNNKLLKVIIETCLLNDDEKIIACLLSKTAGADYVKTSTGFSLGGATIEDVQLMRRIVGNKIGVKASGGIRTREFTIQLLNAGASRIGASKGLEIIGVKK